MINVVTGKPRHGKTYFVVSMIPEWLYNGERIFSNVKINVEDIKYKPRPFSKAVSFSQDIIGNIKNPADLANPNKKLFYWSNIHEWNLMNNGIIIVDEAQRYFNARAWNQLSPETEIKLQQHGKEDLDVWAITQHYSRIDITLRILVELFYKVDMRWGSPNNEGGPLFGLIPKRSHYESWLLEDLEKIERLGKRVASEDSDIQPETKGNFWIKKQYYSIYNTREKVGESELMPLIHKKRTCSICGHIKIEHV